MREQECRVLIILVVILIVKIVLMRRSMGEIASSLNTILSNDTNVLITVSFGDRYIKRLAVELNAELFRYTVILAQDKPELEAVDIGAVLEESILSFYGAMTEAGIVPEISITEEHVIRQSNRAAMSCVFGNIIANALKYSDGDFCVSMDDDGLIMFKNHASNLDKLRVEKLFDRFYTVQEARGSTGLRLSHEGN